MQMSFRNRERLLGLYLFVDSVAFTVLTLILASLMLIAALAYDLGGFWIWGSVGSLAIDAAKLTWQVRRMRRQRGR